MIGIFDSGVGGLTVLHEIQKHAPQADIIYFGDSLHAPYGNKSQEEVRELSIQGIQKLLDRGATDIVSACNSVSISLDATALEALKLTQEHLIEMVGPTLTDLSVSPAQRILLLGTNVTIASGFYQRGLQGQQKEVAALPIPELAGAIEDAAEDDEIRNILTTSLQGIDTHSFDLVLLGCTHYPLAAGVIREFFPSTVHIYDPAEAVAREVVNRFTISGHGSISYMFSKKPRRAFC